MSNADPNRPSAEAHLREDTVSSEVVYQGKFLTMKRDMVRLPDGRQASREYVVHPGAVMVVAILPDDRLVMERQYRYPVGQTMIEFPAGKLDPGEGGLACAQRELWEETGYKATRWAKAGVMHPVIGYATEFIEVWFAQGLTLHERHLDEGEFLDVYAASLDELEAGFRDGTLTDAKTVVGMMWLQQWRAGRTALNWVDVGA
jgi:ADP-ribose pyrophosphatase